MRRSQTFFLDRANFSIKNESRTNNFTDIEFVRKICRNLFKIFHFFQLFEREKRKVSQIESDREPRSAKPCYILLRECFLFV